MHLNDQVAEQIAKRLNQAGFDRCTPGDVWDVYKHGSVAQGVISDDHDAALESAILQQFDEYEVEPL